MLRRIIEIDEKLCNGCGICAEACHEGAIEMMDGKAKLMRDDYCDGLGDCLPQCPTGAISFIEKDTLEFDKEAVMANMAKKAQGNKISAPSGGCPGSAMKSFERKESECSCGGDGHHEHGEDHECSCHGSDDKQSVHNVGTVSLTSESVPSELMQWPCQIKLLPLKAPFYQNANLLIAADCAAFAYGNFHKDFMKNRITMIGCPKLDDGDYAEKLTEIIKQNEIKSVTIVRMQVPCCGGLENAAKRALQASGKFIPWSVVTISSDGKVLDR